MVFKMVFKHRPVQRKRPAKKRERPAESSPAEIPAETSRQRTQAPSTETAQSISTRPTSAILDTRPPAQQHAPAPRALTAGSVEDMGVTVHRVRLGPDVQEIEVARSAGVQVGDHNRQLNHYQFRIDRPEVSLERLLEGPSATQRSFERLVANPNSWIANYAFRHHLSGATAGSGFLFADPTRAPTVRIGTHVDEHGTRVVDSRGVQVADHSFQRNSFSYK